MIHGVIDGVPCWSERALLAVRIVWDDVDAWDACHLVHWHVVVGDANTVLLWEERAVACHAGSLPHLRYDARGLALRVVFLVELRSFATDHVEEDSPPLPCGHIARRGERKTLLGVGA